MQGNYSELAKSNKDFMEMIDNLATSHQEQKKEEEARRISEISNRKQMMLRRPSALSAASSIAVKKIKYLNSFTLMLLYRLY